MSDQQSFQNTKSGPTNQTLQEKAPAMAEQLTKIMEELHERIAKVLVYMTPDKQSQMFAELQQFSNNLNSQITSENLKDPERILIAVRGLNALLGP